MRQIPPIIDEPPRGAGARARHWLRGRRFSLAGLLALAEVIAVLVWRPGTIAASALAFVVLVLAVMGIGRVRSGLLRDLLVIVAIAQGLVLVIPILIGFSFVLGLIAAAVLLVLLIG
ncbi:MAG TPA: hypothetical protein VNU01_10445, partial [Egibacteraceae bacterium]|nr:hypothetical protein [Egibacteraceae bacterium]